MTSAAKVFRYGAALLAVTFALVPIVWTLSTSLKTDSEAMASPPTLFPSSIYLDNYLSVINQSSIPFNMRNSLILEFLTILLVLVVGVHAGYAAARFEFRGKNVVLLFLIATIMIPGIVTLIPQYLIAVQLGLQGTFLGLVLVFSAWQAPMVVWVMKAFFERIPRALEEAAMVDGCTRMRAFYRIVLPLSWPGIAASSILVFLWVWNEFIISLVLSGDDTRPLTVGLFFFVGDTGIEWGKLSAGAVVVLLPAIIFFISFQRRLVAGLTAGAVK